jgi:hypothetical protein
VDILEASGAFDPGSSPGRGVFVFQAVNPEFIFSLTREKGDRDTLVLGSDANRFLVFGFLTGFRFENIHGDWDRDQKLNPDSSNPD